MTSSAEQKLVVAISSRALFDLEDSHRVFTEQGVEAYCRYQIEHENDPLEPGAAFPVVKKLLALNGLAPLRERVEVILISRNSADTGLRVFNSVSHYGLEISRAAFAGGASPFRYVEPFGAQLFLSANAEDVGDALEAGFAAATLMPRRGLLPEGDALRIAFDGVTWYPGGVPAEPFTSPNRAGDRARRAGTRACHSHAACLEHPH